MGQVENEKCGVLEQRIGGKFFARRGLSHVLVGIFVMLGIVIIFLVISNYAQAGDYGVAITHNSPANGIADVMPGNDEAYTLDVQNTGDLNPGEDINLTVELDAASIAAGWTVTPTGTTIIPNVQMGAENKTTEPVWVRAPMDAKYEDTAVVTITVEVIGHQGEVGCQDSLQLRANVLQIYGVRVSTIQDDRTGDPGEEISFSLKVKNEGNDNDTYAFSHLGFELGEWGVTDPDLGPGEFVYVYYNLTIDSDHNTTDILVTLKVTSTDDISGLTYDTLDITIHVNPRFEVKLGVNGSNTKDVYGGGSATFNLTIQNRGTATDTFDIEPVGTEGFWATPSTLTVTLAPQEKTIVEIWVEPPYGTAMGIFNIIINVTSQNNDSATGEYTFYVDIRASYDLFLSLPTMNVKAGPNETIIITIIIKNEGNAEDTIEIIIDLPPGWSLVHPPPGPINPFPDETESIDIAIYIPPGTPSGLYRINVTARSVNDPTKEMTFTLIIEVQQAYNVSLQATTTEKTGDVGETVQYLIQLENNGNGEDCIELRLTGEHPEFGILYYNETENGQIIHVSPPPGGALGVYLNVTIPSDYWDIKTQDQFWIAVEAESLDDTSSPPAGASKVFTTTVNPVYGVDIISGWFTSGEPNRTISFPFKVENTGTVTDSYDISMESVSTETGGDTGLWYSEIYFNPTNITDLAKGATASVTMYVNIPFPPDLYLIPPGIYNITVEVSSSSDTDVKDTQIFQVNVQQYYWTVIQDNVATKNVNVGETVHYTITIKNKGNDYDLLSVDLEGDIGIPGSENWGKLSHAGTGQFDQQTLVDIGLDAGASTVIILNITIPDRTDPAYPANDPDDITLTVNVEDSDEIGPHEWVMVTADINPIYEFAFTFLAKTLDVEPGDQAKFTIKIENQGTSSETFTYEIFQWEVDWSAYGYSFLPSSILIPAGDIEPVTLTIDTPSDLEDFESRDYNITIKVHSAAGDTDLFENCTIYLEPVYDVDLTTTGSTSKAVNVGNVVTYQFSVRNTGNAHETYQLTASDQDTSSNGGGDQSSWVSMYLVADPLTPVTSVDMNSGESKAMILEISVPLQDDPDFAELTSALQIEVEVTSSQEEDVTDDFTTDTTINSIFSFTLSSTAPFNTKEGTPGNPVSFTLVVTNTGTATDRYTFRFSSRDETKFPEVSVDNINVDVDVGETKTTTATISINDENDKAIAGTYQIGITGDSQGDKGVHTVILLNITIEAAADVAISADPTTASEEPGESIDYSIKITNEGNTQDTFLLTLTGEAKDWTTILNATDLAPITQVTLDAGGVTDVILRVTIPSTGETTALNPYAVTIKAASISEDVFDTVQVSTQVEEYVDLLLTYSSSEEPWVDFDPNKAQPRFRFKVTNNGNIDETGIAVNLNDMPVAWSSPIIDPIDTLEPGKSTTFQITFSIPTDEDEGEYTMQVYVTSSDGSMSSDPVNITINLIKPDLAVSSADISGLDDTDYLLSRVGNAVTITARIHNIGHTKAEKVQVKLYEDTTVRGTETISYITVADYRDIDFRWVVVAEEVEMKVRITPVEEIDEDNNEISSIFLDLRPDLSFTGEKLNFSKASPRPGEHVTITAFVKNDGGNVEDVVVKFYADNKIIKTDTIDIDYGETAVATIEWEMPDTSGESITFRAEIEKSSAPGYGGGTTRSIKVHNPPERISEASGGTYLIVMALGLVFCAVIFLILGIAIGSMRKRPEEDREFQDRDGSRYDAYEKTDEDIPPQDENEQELKMIPESPPLPPYFRMPEQPLPPPPPSLEETDDL